MSTNPTPQEISDGLLAARELMNSKGGRHWIKGALKSHKWFGRHRDKREACYCSAGAIMEVAGTNRRLATAMLKQLASVVRYGTVSRVKDARGYIFEWNDSSWRTWDEVSRGFRLAAKNARESA